MAPCINQKVLNNCLCDFKNAHTGLGIDQLWKMYSDDEKDKIYLAQVKNYNDVDVDKKSENYKLFIKNCT